MKNIIILNGAARKNGNTAKLIKAFTEGANSVGNTVREFYLVDMNIKDCTGCECCGGTEQCAQSDDMREIYKAFEQADVVVFASPVYFWTVSGTLKTAVDRLYAEMSHLGYSKFPRESVWLMTAGGSDYSQALTWYRFFEKNLGWKSCGEVLGSGKTKEAYRLGENI